MVKFFKNCKESFKHIPYTYKHIVAFNRLQKQTFGKHKYKFHDWDKLIMYLIVPYLGTRKIKEIHKKISKHHIKAGVYDIKAYEEALIDWESAHLTKWDKPHNAYWTIKNKGKRDKFQTEYLETTLHRLHLLNPDIKMECIKYSQMGRIRLQEIKEV